MPPKICELIRDLKAAGFVDRSGKGSHRNLFHPAGVRITLSGSKGGAGAGVEMKRKSAQYLKIVEWSEEDDCFVGRCPELMLGGVHGKNEQKVFADLCAVIDEWIIESDKRGEKLPPGMSGKQYSGKFNLRVDKQLHERLAFEALKQGKSLNTFCAEALENVVSR